MSDAAVCLTFDDRFYANWHAAREIFAAHGISASFCVFGLHEATDQDVSMLRDLQDDGHEIVCHSQTHPRLLNYVEDNGVDAWMSDEVVADQTCHRALGFPGTAFASPHHRTTPETRARCAEVFDVTRGAGPLRHGARDLGRRIYHALPSDRTLDNLGMIDLMHPKQGGFDWLKQCLEGVVEQNGLAVFTGHDIRPTRTGAGYYLTRRQLLRVCRLISRLGLATRTLTQAANQLGQMPNANSDD